MEVEGEEALGRMVVLEGPDSSPCPGWAGSSSRQSLIWALQPEELQVCGAPAELLLSGVGRLSWLGTVG